MRLSMKTFLILSGVTIGIALVGGCAGSHGAYTTEGLNVARDRMAVIKSGTQWDMARQEFLTGDLNKALKSVDESIAINESVPKSHTLRGQILMELGQLEQASKALTRALAIDPSFTEAHYYLGVLYERFGELDSALDKYQAAAALAPSNAQYTLASAEVLLDMGRLAAAKTLLNQKKSDFEHNAGIRQTLAHIASMEHDAPLAAKLFGEARMLDPDDESIMEDLAVAQVEAEQYVEAEYTLHLLLKKPAQKDRRDLKQLEARCLVALDRPVEARSILLGLTSDDAGLSDVDAWVELGQVAYMLGDMQRVRIAAGRVRTLDPTRYEGPLLRALWERAKGNLEGALTSASKAQTLVQGADNGPAVVRGLILHQMGRQQDAKESALDALSINPNDEGAKKLLALVSPDGE